MSGNRFIFNREDSFTSGDLAAFTFMYFDEEFKDYSELQNIPYTSSSFDRSSVGSIPWSDDTIKKNLLDWERIERMLYGKEEITTEPTEEELRNEIQEWRCKFPQHFGVKMNLTQHIERDTPAQPDNVVPIEHHSISNLTLNSINEDGNGRKEDNGKIGAVPSFTNKKKRTPQHSNVSALDGSPKLSRNVIHGQNKVFHISSVPLPLYQGHASNKSNQSRKGFPENSSSSSSTHKIATYSNGRANDSHLLPAYSVAIKDDNIKTSSDFHMPPILNVLNSKRRFLGRAASNRSFVQLTEVQQAKSAVIAGKQKREMREDQSSSWHLPLATAAIRNRFLNNRNTIILPSINSQQQRISAANDFQNNDELRNFSSDSSASSGGFVSNGQRSLKPPLLQHNIFNRIPSTTTTPISTSSNGRSISAAVNPQTRQNFNAFYFPYSASKFKVLK